jgi:CPA2 family monovalent cation:H+ antiporter-2
LGQFYQRIEERFISNLNEREKHSATHKQLTPWDAHLARIKIGAHGSFLGETLEELRFREKFGINIAFIERGGRFIYAPSRHEKIFPYDEIGVIGTDTQLQKFTNKVALREDEENPKNDMLANSISLEKIIVDEHNGLKGKSIRSSGIREITHGLVVGIERNSARMLNPASDTMFEWADVVWIVGDANRIRHLREHGE